MGAADVAELTGGSYERFHKALKGERGLTPETLHLFAEALGTTVMAIKWEAGVLSEEERRQLARQPRFEDVVERDRLLSPEARRVLIGMYRQLTQGSSRD